jgi:hypothetical protein
MPRLRSGVLAAWATAWLTGDVGYDDVSSRVTGDDEPHRVAGLPGSTGAVPLGWVLTVLRERSADGLRLVLPVPGDPRGLPGRGPFSAAAVEAGEAAIGGGLGLAPVVTEHGSPLGSRTTCVSWQAFLVSEPSPDPLTLAEAEHDLAVALRTSASALAVLDVASWRDDLDAELARVRRWTSPELPPAHEPRAVRVLAQADRLATILDLAEVDAPGGALSGHQARARADALRPLRAAVRRAQLAAYNAVPSHRR